MIRQIVFSRSRAERDSFCQEKDSILLPLLNKYVKVRKPRDFRAILMPALYGIEAFWLREHGVPAKNIFAVENDYSAPGAHAEIVSASRPDRKILKGIQTTSIPMPFMDAVDEAYWAYKGKPFSLVYLDFLSQPDIDLHYRYGILKLFRANMLSEHGTLILNFGRGRSKCQTATLNRLLFKKAKVLKLTTHRLPVELYIGAAIVDSGHRPFKTLITKTYGSAHTEFTTTLVQF